MESLERRPLLLGGLLMTGAAMLFAVMAVATRQAARELSAAELVVVRFTIMALGVLAVRAGGRIRLKPQNLRLLLVRGVLGGGAVLLYFVALAKSRDAGTASLIQYTSPIFTSVFAWFALSERPGTRVAAGGLLALCGVLLVLHRPGGFALGPGEIAGIGSSILAGSSVVAIRAARAHDNAFTILFAFSVCGALLALPFALPGWSWGNPTVWAVALVIGVSSFFAQLMMTHAFGLVTAGRGALYQLLTPVFTYGMGAVLLAEPVTLQAALGAALTVVAVAWAAVPTRPAKAPVRPLPSPPAVRTVAPEAPTLACPAGDGADERVTTEEAGDGRGGAGARRGPQPAGT